MNQPPNLPTDVRLAGQPDGPPAAYPGHEPRTDHPAAGSTLGYTPERILRALRRRWYFALAAGAVVAVVLGYVANGVVSSNYTARTQVFVAISQPMILTDTGGTDTTTYQRRQAALVRSRPVLQAAINRPKVADLKSVRTTADPVAWLERDLKVDFSVAPEIMTITLTGPDPGELTAILDAVRESYLEEGVNKDLTDKKARLEQLDKVMAEDRTKHEAARSEVTRKAAEFRAPDATEARHRHLSNMTRLANLQTKVFQLESQLQGWDQSRVDLEASPPQKTSAGPIRPADLQATIQLIVAHDRLAQTAAAEIARLTPEIEHDRGVAAKGVENPKLAGKIKDLEEAHRQLAAREKAAQEEGVRKLAADATLDYDARVREHQFRLSDLKAQVARTRGELGATAAEVKKLDADTLAEARGIAELDRLAARASDIEDRIKVAKNRAEVLEIELQAPHRARTQEEAVIIQVPNPGKKQKMVAAAVAVGFLAGLAGIAFLDLRTGRIDSPSGVDRHLHTGVVGCIPRTTPATIAALTRTDGSPTGPATETLCDAVDACRALLLNALPAGRARVIMVSSATAGEGKTSVAAQLALSLGRAGYRTLLIDGDMRKPSVHSLFGRTQTPGLADVLRKTYPVERVGRKSPLPNLLILPAGVCHPNEAVSLLQLRLSSVLRKCKNFFDVIVIDTPPLSLPDAMIIGRQADGTILSLMNEVSTLPAAQAACARLRAMNIPLLGAVLNGAPERSLLGYGY